MDNNAIRIYNDGYYYFKGKNGYPLDYNKALECFNQAAKLGVSDAMNYLGIMYFDGTGVEKNYSLAAAWFVKAIQTDSGNAHAAYNLGRMYYLGVGVNRDMVMAYNLCEAAVKLGLGNTHSSYPQSCYLTGCILLEHYKNKNEAYPYFIDAAKYGDIAEAWHNLGYLTEQRAFPEAKKLSTPEIDALARDFYKKAVDKGYAQSMAAMARICILYDEISKARALLEKAVSLGYEPAKKQLKWLKFI